MDENSTNTFPAISLFLNQLLALLYYKLCMVQFSFQTKTYCLTYQMFHTPGTTLSQQSLALGLVPGP